MRSLEYLYANVPYAESWSRMAHAHYLVSRLLYASATLASVLAPLSQPPRHGPLEQPLNRRRQKRLNNKQIIFWGSTTAAPLHTIVRPSAHLTCQTTFQVRWASGFGGFGWLGGGTTRTYLKRIKRAHNFQFNYNKQTTAPLAPPLMGSCGSLSTLRYTLTSTCPYLGDLLSFHLAVQPINKSH